MLGVPGAVISSNVGVHHKVGSTLLGGLIEVEPASGDDFLLAWRRHTTVREGPVRGPDEREPFSRLHDVLLVIEFGTAGIVDLEYADFFWRR